MKKKLTRIGIIEYCKKCKHIKKDGLTTICGLTNSIAGFEYGCENFSTTDVKGFKKSRFWNSWIFPLLMSIGGFMRFFLRSSYKDYDILGIVFFILGIAWLFVAIFNRILK